MKILWIGKGRKPFEVGDIVSDKGSMWPMRVEKIEGGVLHGKSIYAGRVYQKIAVSDALMVVKRRDQ